MKPSETDRGHRWIKNFDPDDRPTARLLLDSVRFASTGHMVTSIRDRLIALVTEGQIEAPVFLIPALSATEDISALPEEEMTPELFANLPERHVAYKTYIPNSGISSTPGSEGLIGRIVRDIIAHRLLDGATVLPAESSLEDIRAARCRSIVLVTDYNGSGTQIRDFAKTLVRHPTLRSWRSGKFLRIHALAFASTEHAAKNAIFPGSPLDGYSTLEIVKSLQDPSWSEIQRESIERLCKRYTIKKMKRDALGYKSSGGLFVSDFGVPNNIPAILRQKSDGWSSFFENRVVPQELVTELRDYTPITPLSRSAATAGQIRLARNLKEDRGRLSGRLMLTALSEINAGKVSDEDLSFKLCVTVPTAESIVESLLLLGFISKDRKLTEDGRKELNAGKKSPRKVVPLSGGSDEPYYPRTMR